MEDRFDLARFRDAQDHGAYAQALEEIKGGRKTSHWMWYVFPQMRGLGRSGMSWRYGVSSADEARAYLDDEVLGARLREISEALLELDDTDPRLIMGTPDWLKLRSCMTLFDHVSPGDVFERVLLRLYSGARCHRTLSLL